MGLVAPARVQGVGPSAPDEVRYVSSGSSGGAGEAEAMNARHLHPAARKNTAVVRLVSRRALTAAGASVRELPGTSPDVAAWIREAA